MGGGEGGTHCPNRFPKMNLAKTLRKACVPEIFFYFFSTPDASFSTNSSSHPRTRFHPSPWPLADSLRLPANPSCVTRTSVPVPDFF